MKPGSPYWWENCTRRSAPCDRKSPNDSFCYASHQRTQQLTVLVTIVRQRESLYHNRYTPSAARPTSCDTLCSRNAAIYGVENRIEFILGDAMKVLPTLKADAVFLSPPWGGPAYQDVEVFDLHSMIPPPLSALEIFTAARAVTPNVVFFLPRNIDHAQIAGLPAAAAAAVSRGAAGALEAGTGTAVEPTTRADERDVAGFDETCEVELQFLNGKLKTTTAYFGSDIAAVGKTKPAEVVGEGRPESSSSSTERVTEGTLAWTGRHVRFSDDGDDKVGLGSEVDWATPTPSGNGQEIAPPPSQKRETRENALYEAWMTPATTH